MPYPSGHGACDIKFCQTASILCLTNLKPVHRQVVLHCAAYAVVSLWMALGGARVAVFLVFLAFLVFFDFGVGVKAGGLGYGLLSRLGLPAWDRFPLPPGLSAFLVFLVFPAFGVGWGEAV